MKVSCPSCQTHYNIDDKRIPAGGAKLKCAKCQTTFPIKGVQGKEGAVPLPGAGGGGAIPLPGSAGAGAIPLPGGAGAGAIPLPGGAGAGAIPLPGGAPGAVPLPGAPGSGAVPLPGQAGAAAIPLPDAGSVTPAFGGSARVGGGAIPLPGAAPGPGRAIPLPGSTPPPLPRSGPPPLPPAAFGAPAQADGDDGSTRAYDTSALASMGLTRPGAVPLPGAGAAPDALAFGPSTASTPAPVDFGAPPSPSDTGRFGMPVPSEDVGLDFSDVGDAAPARVPLPPPPPAGAFDFGEVPGATGAAPGAFSFTDLPSAGAPAPADLSFGDLPSPSGAGAFDFGDLPSPSGAPAAAGAFAFGDLPAPAAAPGAAGAVDFGAAAAPDPSLDFGEVDFGAPSEGLDFGPAPGGAAPARPAAGPAMLGFIDGGTPAAGGAPRYTVRRSSGKVFGPFEEAVLVKMLEDGQLLGNEDLSLDGSSWAPIAEREPFASALQRRAQGSPGGLAAPEQGRAVAPDSSSAALEKLRQVYEGRMAAVAVVDGHGKPAGRVRRSLTVLGVLAAVVVLLVGAGASLGFTRYGAFGVKKLFPARIAPGTAEAQVLQKARAALLSDTAAGYRRARDAAAGVLAVEEYPELRAVWCRAVFGLQRSFSEGKAAELAQARAALDELELLGEREPEVVKARASAALTAGRGAEARDLLQGASEGGQKDPELQLLLAEAYLLERDRASAQATLTRVLAAAPMNARAHHMLAELHLRTGRLKEEAGAAAAQKLAALDAAAEPKQAEQLREEQEAAAAAASEAFEKAAASFRKALQVGPDHLQSALELAELELQVRRDAQAALKALAPVLAEGAEKALLPAQRARALALQGVALLQSGQAEEAERQLRAALELDPKSTAAKTPLGRILFARRAYADALPLLRDVHQVEPGNLEAVDGYLQVLLATGQPEEAHKVAEAANGRFPGNARIAYLTGRVEDARGVAGAEEHYKRALHADPTLVPAHLHLARLHLRARRLAEARTQLEALARQAPDGALLHVGRGELALAEGDAAGARAGFERALQLAPKLADAHLGRSRVAALEGSLTAARTAAEAALAQDPALGGARQHLGELLFRLGELEAAEKELTRAREEAPRSVPVLVRLGEVKLARKDAAGAEATLREALQLEPFHAEALLAMGNTLVALGQYEGGLERLRQAVREAPERVDYKFVLGKVLLEAKKASEAVEVWKAAVAQDPKYVDALEALGQAALDGHRHREAVRYLEQALAQAPGRTHLVALLGDAHANAGDFKQAVARYQAALKADPSARSLYGKVGRAYLELEQVKVALPWLERAVAAEPDNAQSRVSLAYALKSVGRKREAAAAFRAYLKARPDAPDRKDVEDEIYAMEKE